MKNKITVISHTSELYGAPKSLIPILEILNKEFIVDVITFGEEGLPQKLNELSIPCRVIPLVKYNRKSIISRIMYNIQKRWGDYYFTNTVKKLLQSNKPDLVYVNTVSRGAPLIAANKLCLPVAIHVRESVLYFNRSKRVDRRRINAVVNIPQVYFTVSNSTRDLVIDNGVSPEKIFAVHSGLDLTIFTPDNSFKVNNSIGFLGNITERKGITEYLEISKELIKSNKNLTSFVIGGDLNSIRLKNIIHDIKEKGFKDNFTFTGKINNVVDYYRKMEVFCLTSREEPFARVLIEAMACGLPVVAFDTGGVSELVEDGVNGYIIPKGDITQYIEKLKQLLKDKNLREEMGKKGREKVLSNFQLSDYTRRIYEIIIPSISSAMEK